MYNDVEEELLISINELEFKDENVYLVSMNYLFNYVETMYSLFTKLDEAIEFTIHRFAEFSSIYEKNGTLFMNVIIVIDN